MKPRSRANAGTFPEESKMTKSRRMLVDDLDRLDHTTSRRRRNPAFEAKLVELDLAIAALVKATAEDYFAARERLLPNPFRFDSLGNLLSGK